MGRAAVRVVLASFVEAQLSIHGMADFCGIFVLLSIVLPPADRAQCQGAGCLQRPVSATRATKTGRHSVS